MLTRQQNSTNQKTAPNKSTADTANEKPEPKDADAEADMKDKVTDENMETDDTKIEVSLL